MDDQKEKKKLKLAHSPDSDDAFMFWGLATGEVAVEGFEFEHILSDIQSLNQAALAMKYDITAISLHAYPYVANNYALMNVGASVGDGYGPIVVSRDPLNLKDLPELTVAIPGSLTTAALVLRLAVPGVRTEEVAFDQIGDAVKDGQVDAGVIIHEGQVTWQDEGFHNVVDLGVWWQEQTGLPLPLGANVIKRELGEEAIVLIADGIRKSVAYGLENRPEAVKYAQDYGRNLIQEKVDQFVGMYVNDFTLDWGRRGRLAVEELLLRGAEAGIVPKISSIDFVG